MLAPINANTVPSPQNAAGAPPPPIVDDTAETLPDTAALVADEFSRHVEFALVAQQTRQQEAQLRLDGMKADFNESEQERSEMLREMNALRDMAIEQAKKDDDILKKYIAMI